MMTEPATSADSTRPAPDEFHDLGELIVFHRGEWTEADYEVLPVGVRAELHDGKLILAPSPASEHLLASKRLVKWLDALIGDDRLVIQEVDVRMADGRRYRTPDLSILRRWQRGRPLSPKNVLLVAEIVSPGSGDEYGEKMTAYFDAGIEWYLIVEETPAGFRGEVYRRGSEKYQLVSRAGPAETLELPEPIGAGLDLRNLSRPGSGPGYWAAHPAAASAGPAVLSGCDGDCGDPSAGRGRRADRRRGSLAAVY